MTGSSRDGSKEKRPSGTPYDRESSSRNTTSNDKSKDKYWTNHMTACNGDESLEEEDERTNKIMAC